MKKKIYAVVLCVFMCVVMCVPVLADEKDHTHLCSAEALMSCYLQNGGDSRITNMVGMYYCGYNNVLCLERAWFFNSDCVGYIDGDNYFFLNPDGSRAVAITLSAYSGKYYNYPSEDSAIPVDIAHSVSPNYNTVKDYTLVHKIFNSKQSALNYLSNGSLDGLIYDGSAIGYDSSVPAPTEVHIESRYLADEGCPRTTIAFKSSETYESSGMQTEIRYRYSGTFYESGVFGDSKTNRKAFTSPIYKKDLIKTLSVNYVGNTSNNNTVIMNWYDEFMDNDAYKNYAEYKEVEANKHSISWIAAPFNSIEYWIRNVTSDNKASDWVHCKYNYDTGKLEETWTDTVPGGRTDVIDGNVEPGKETPGDIKDSYEIDSSIKNDGGFDTNSSGLISSIKDLFSDNGVVGMVKAIFGFMPGWMIAYVSLFFTILIALMILYFVRG